MHPLTELENDGLTPLLQASGAPAIYIYSTLAPSSPKSNKSSLRPILLSKEACEACAKEVHQLMPRASKVAFSIDAQGIT